MHIYLQNLKMSANDWWRKTVKTNINSSVLSDLKGFDLPLGDDPVVGGAVDWCLVVLVICVDAWCEGWPFNE